VDLRGHIIDGLDKSLVPLGNRTGEVRSSGISANLDTGSAVYKEAGAP